MTPGKFHPSQRAWPSGMPESIAQTEHKDPKVTVRPLTDQDELIEGMKEASKLNLVHVYCPNTGCDWHVRVDEKVRDYNRDKHMLMCEFATIPVKDTDLAWAAGFFEGEGCISIRRNQKKAPYPRLALNNTDREMILRFQSILGGKIYGPYVKPASKKPQYCWAVYKVKEVQRVLDLLRPWLSQRRLDQERLAWDAYREHPCKRQLGTHV